MTTNTHEARVEKVRFLAQEYSFTCQLLTGSPSDYQTAVRRLDKLRQQFKEAVAELKK